MRIRELPARYLRAADASHYDPATLQRRSSSDHGALLFDGRTGKPLSALLSKRRRRAHRREGAPESKEAADDGAGAPAIIQECSLTDGDSYRVVWTDGLVSQYSVDWVEKELKQWKGGSTADGDARTLWSGLTEEQVRCSSSSSLCQTFDQVVRGTQEGMTTALKTLYEYGILLVTHTPIHDRGAGVAALAAALGGGAIKNDTSLWTRYNNNNNQQRQSNGRASHGDGDSGNGTDGPLRTLYGTVWSTTTAGQAAGASVADSAYGHDALPLHTDMTYHRDPPGLQIFTMVQPAAKGGGESVFGDGWAVAEELRRVHPDAFDTLSQTVRRYRCVDRETGWHLEASGPVLQVDHNRNKVVMVRHNDLDRLPDLPPPSATTAETGVDEFYQRLEEAHAAWDELLARDETRLKIALRPGDTMVVANQVSRSLARSVS